MRIAVAASGLGHVSRGIEAWAAYLGEALHARGREAVLYRAAGEPAHSYEKTIPCWIRSDPRTARALRVLPNRFFWRVGLGTAYDIEQTTFAMNLLRHLRRDRIDILHVKDPQVCLIVQRANQMGLVPTRAILSHGTEESARVLRKIRYLHHLSPAHQAEARAAGIDRPDWRMISNFIDTDRFCPGDGSALRAELGIPAGALTVLCAAAIKSDHKRIDYLLDEFATLAASAPDLPVHLIVAGGRAADTDALIERGRQTLGERVHFIVNFPLARMPELYRTADLFALCSLKEMLGTALLEAAATQVPCLVHQHPSMQWVVGPGGESLDMTSPGALAASMQSLLRDAERRRSLGEKARRHCVNTFGRDRIVDQYLDFYQAVFNDGRPVDGAVAQPLGV